MSTVTGNTVGRIYQPQSIYSTVGNVPHYDGHGNSDDAKQSTVLKFVTRNKTVYHLRVESSYTRELLIRNKTEKQKKKHKQKSIPGNRHSQQTRKTRTKGIKRFINT